MSDGIGVPLFLGDLCRPLACFSHLLAQPGNFAILMILGTWYPSGRFFVYSSVSHEIGVPLFHGDL